jgi:hypothetical protein
LRGACPLSNRLLNCPPEVRYLHIALNNDLFNIVAFKYVSPHRASWGTSCDKYAARVRVANPHHVKQLATLKVTICLKIKVDQRDVVRNTRLQQFYRLVHRLGRVYIMVTKSSLDELKPFPIVVHM